MKSLRSVISVPGVTGLVVLLSLCLYFQQQYQPNTKGHGYLPQPRPHSYNSQTVRRQQQSFPTRQRSSRQSQRLKTSFPRVSMAPNRRQTTAKQRCYRCAGHGIPTANFSFASYYGDHMVLQQTPKRATIWGYASKLSDIVTILLDNTQVGTTTTRLGPAPGIPVWSITLPAMKAGGPHTITVKSSEGQITLSDVLFGDVWVCSGQSNMQFTVSMGFNASEEIADSSNHPNIRVFTVAPKESRIPQYDLLYIRQKWSVPSKESIGGAKWMYFSAVCWLYGKYLSNTLKYPIGLIATSYGGTPIEAWLSPEALARCRSKPGHKEHRITARGPGANSVLWNAMVRPLVNMTIYGAIWYQGEGNALPGQATEFYNCRFPAMIDDWREKFAEGSNGQTSHTFPFGFVQLAPWRDKDVTTGFTDIRWHQTADYGYVPNERMKNVFMAVAIDLPDFASPFVSLHPRDKQDVAQRLYSEGLAVAYNRTDMVKYRSPFPTEFKVLTDHNATVVIAYDNHMTTIETRTSVGFEACCVHCDLVKDKWFAIPITASSNTTVSVYYGAACSSKDKPSIGAIRYAWRESPCAFKKCAVYNKLSGYPAPPFVKYIYGGKVG